MSAQCLPTPSPTSRGLSDKNADRPFAQDAIDKKTRERDPGFFSYIKVLCKI